MDLKANAFKQLQPDSLLPVERVLGLWWDSQTDHFTFRLNDSKLKLINDGNKSWTKRDVRKLMASIFDPLGMLAHFIIKARITFQHAWRTSVEWDEPPTDAIRKSWLKWCQMLPEIENVNVPRFNGMPPSTSGPTLHVFADASTEASAAVAYFRWGREDCAGVSFVDGKARVAPLKPLTVPRLELTAALMAVRLATTIMKEHNYEVNDAVFWSDSRIALSWIRPEAAQFKQFVAARVGEMSSPKQWKWVPTAENPTDDATRLLADIKINPEARWPRGPKFLTLNLEDWPTEPMTEPIETETSELRPTFVCILRDMREDPTMPEMKRFSSWPKLIRTTAWVVRYIQNLRYSPKVLNALASYEILDAEYKWIRKVQAECFPEDVALLKAWKEVPNSSRLYTF